VLALVSRITGRSELAFREDEDEADPEDVELSDLPVAEAPGGAGGGEREEA
jgi:hypothetical protein